MVLPGADQGSSVLRSVNPDVLPRILKGCAQGVLSVVDTCVLVFRGGWEQPCMASREAVRAGLPPGLQSHTPRKSPHVASSSCLWPFQAPTRSADQLRAREFCVWNEPHRSEDSFQKCCHAARTGRLSRPHLSRRHRQLCESQRDPV